MGDESSIFDLILNTDKDDYAPGETAIFTLDGVTIGGSVEFHVLHVSDPGDDGLYGTADDTLDAGPDGEAGTADDGYGTTGEGHEPFTVTDGVYEIQAGTDGLMGTADDVIIGDRDMTVNGVIETTWYVNPDDSADETFLLTATDTTSGAVATTSFTDSVGDFSIDFAAAEPTSYNHFTGGGAFDDDTSNVDIVESLQGGEFACGDIVTYFAKVEVTGDGNDDPQTIEMDFSFLADSTGQSGAAVGDIVNVEVNYGTIQDLIPGENDLDDAFIDDGGSIATLLDEYFLQTQGNTDVRYEMSERDEVLFEAKTTLNGTIELTDLEQGEIVVVRIDVQLFCDPGSTPTGNLQADLLGARLTATEGIPLTVPEGLQGFGGAQTIPWNQIGDLNIPVIDIVKEIVVDDLGDDDLSNDNTVNSTTIFAGEEVTYHYTVTNFPIGGDPTAAPLYNVVVVDDNGTPLDDSDDFEVILTQGLTDEDGDGDEDDLAGGATAYGIATVTLNDVGTVVNTATATGVDNPNPDVTQTEFTDTDDATVIVEQPPFTDPVISIVKTAGDAADGETYHIDEGGESVTYSYAVTNNSPVDQDDDPLTITSLVDDRGTADTGDDVDLLAGGAYYVGGDTDTDGLLDEGETWQYSYTTDVLLDANESLTNVVTVTGNDGDGGDDVSDTDDAVVTAEDVPAVIQVVKTADPTTIDEGGESVTYTYDVTNESTNASDSELTITSLVDDRGTADTGDDVDLLAGGAYYVGGDTDTDGLLDAGETWQYSYTTDVLLDANESLTNVVTVTGNDGDGGDDVSDTDDAVVTAEDVPAVIQVVKTADPTTIDEGGESVTYTYDVTNESTNASDSELTITSLVDDRGTADTGDDVDLLAGGAYYVGGDTDTDGLLDAGETWQYSYTTDVLLDANESLTNVVTVTGNDGDGGDDVSDTDDAVVTAEDVPAVIQVVKTADPTTIDEGGESVTYTYDVTNESTNASDSELTITSLVDDRGTADTGDDVDLLAGGAYYVGGDTDTDGLLDAGETWQYSYTTDVLLDANESLTNVVTVTGNDGDGGDDVSDTDDAVVTAEDVPAVIQVVKTADPTTIDEGGESVTYTYDVTNESTNASDSELTITSLVDDRGTADTGDDVDLLAGGAYYVGGDTDTDGLLDAGETWQYSYTTDVLLDANESLTNVVTVTGNDGDGGDDVSDTDDAVVTAEDVPAVIQVVKTADPTTIDEGGESVTYTYDVTNESTNASDSELTITSLVDDRGTADTGDDVDLLAGGAYYVGGDTDTDGLLDAGETWQYSYTTDVLLDANESLTNVVTVTGNDGDGGDDVSDTDDAVVTAEDVPAVIQVVKTADPTTIDEGGESVTYTYDVTNESTNASDSELTITSLVDDRGTADTGDDVDLLAGGAYYVGGDTDTDGLLDAGETWQYSYTTDVLLDANESLTNVVTVTGNDGDGGDDVSDTDDAVVTAEDVPAVIQVVKTADPTTIDEGGESVTYTYDVTNESTNASDSELTITSLVDDRGTADTGDDVDLLAGGAYYVGGDTDTDGLLDAGETWQYSYTTDVLLDANESLTNVVTVTGNDGDGGDDVSDTDDAVVTAEDVPAVIQVVKTADPTTIDEGGESVTYTYDVTNESTNASDSELTITSLVDDRGTADTGDDVDLLAGGAYYVGGDTDTDGLLDAGETWQYSYTTDVLLDANESLTNVVTVTGNDGDGGDDVSDTDDAVVTAEDVPAVIQVVKTADPTTIDEGGESVTYTYDVTNESTNASDSELTITSLVDDRGTADTGDDVDLLAGGAYYVGGDTDTDGLLDAGETWQYSYTTDVLLDANESLTNVVTVTGNDGDGGDDVSDTDDAVVTAEDVPAVIQVVKTADPTTIDEGGESVTYTYDVTNESTNASDSELTITSLVDDRGTADTGDDVDLLAGGAYYVGGDTDTDGLLDAGETWQYSYTTDVLLDANESLTNVVTVTGNDGDGGDDVSDTDDAVVTAEDVPAVIQVVKTADPTTIDEGGESVTYTYDVTNESTNASDSELTITSLVDDRGTADTGDDVDLLAGGAYYVGGDTDTDGLLDAGETWQYSYTTDVLLDANESLTNVVTVTGNDGDGGDDVSDTDDAVVTAEDVPAVIQVVKTADPTTIDEGGESVTYTYDVTNESTNASDSELTITSLVDDRGTADTGDDVDLLAGGAYYVGGDTDTDGLLDAGETWQYSYTTDVLLDANESLTNVVTVTGNDGDGGDDVSDTDDAVVTAEDVPAVIQVVKTADPTTIDEGGESVTYTYDVTNESTNASDSELTITSLVDDRGTADTGDDVDLLAGGAYYVGGDTDTDGLLDAGETWQYSYTTDVLLDANESLTNVVTVTGNDGDGGDDVSDTDDAVVTAEDVPAVIQVVKTADPTTIDEGGESVTYTYDVTNESTNASDSELTITSLVDDRGTADTGDDVDLLAGGAYYVGGDTDTDGLLDAGETWQYSYTTDVLLDANESLTNVVTVTGNDGDGGDDVSDTDDAVVTAEDVPAVIQVVKTADPTTIDEGGESVTYTYDVTNESTNASDSELTITSLVDDRGTADTGDDVDLLAGGAYYVGGDTDTDGLLDAGETWQYSYTTDVLLDANESLTNVVTVTGNDGDGGDDVSDTDDAVVTAEDVTPYIMVDKLVDADGDGVFSDSELVVEGTFDATYQVTITADADNVSTDPVTVTSIVDDRFGDLLAEAVADNGGADIVLNPGQSFTFDFVETLTLEDGEPGEDPHVNVLTVTAKDDEGTEASDTDDATINVYSGKGQITPTGTTCDMYITGSADDFEDYYDFQNGDIQYGDNNKAPGVINSANPGVFFYYTGLGGFIKDDDGTGIEDEEFTISVDQENQLVSGSTVDDFPLFTVNSDGLKLFEIHDLNNNDKIDAEDTCQQVQLIFEGEAKGQQVANAEFDFNNGDVTLTYLDADPDALYVVGIKYDTDAVEDTRFADEVFDPNDAPTINYTFATSYEGELAETDDQGGVNLSYKFDPNPDSPLPSSLTLDGGATVGGEVLTQDELAPVVDAAIDYWAAQGVDAEGLATLLKTDVRIEDLGGSLLGETTGGVVMIDDDAAGYGWSDSLDDVDADQLDLLSAVTHEFGHVLGYDHSMMDADLAVGERELALDDAQDSDLSGLGIDNDLLFG